MKVTVVGAGNVGATCANCIAEKDIVNEVVLLDIKEGVSEGKSLDMWQTAPINLYDTRIHHCIQPLGCDVLLCFLSC